MREAALMSRPALSRLLRDAQADLRDYGALDALLERQFLGALRHDAAQLTQLAEAITTLATTLERRRSDRVALVTQLLADDQAPSMTALFQRLPPAMRPPIESLWDQLTAAVLHCKSLNVRNARLMTEQQALLQRVLMGDKVDTYADA